MYNYSQDPCHCQEQGKFYDKECPSHNYPQDSCRQNDCQTLPRCYVVDSGCWTPPACCQPCCYPSCFPPPCLPHPQPIPPEHHHKCCLEEFCDKIYLPNCCKILNQESCLVSKCVIKCPDHIKLVVCYKVIVDYEDNCHCPHHCHTMHQRIICIPDPCINPDKINAHFLNACVCLGRDNLLVKNKLKICY